MAKKTATVEEQGVVVRDDNTMTMYDYGEDAGKGFEDLGKSELSIPFVVLLQALSPIVVEEKAKAGQFFNTVTEQLWERDKGFLFVPSARRHYYAEWTPRTEGGGFHGHHLPESAEVREAIKNAQKFGKNKTPDGHDLVETFYLYGVIVDEDLLPESYAAIAFSSTKIRPYKRWITKVSMFTKGKIPLYANLVRITSKQEENEKGKFYVPVFSAAKENLAASLLQKDSEPYIMGKQCAALIDSGDAVIDPNQQSAHGAVAEDEVF